MSNFRCLILIERDVDPDYRDEVSKVLVKAGCLYAMSWGRDCAEWDDSVDWAYILHYHPGPYPDDRSVLTTWHDGWTLEETLEYAKTVENHDIPAEDILILDFSELKRETQIRLMYDAT